MAPRAESEENTLRKIVEILHKKGIDPVQQLRGVFPDDLLQMVFSSVSFVTSGRFVRRLDLGRSVLWVEQQHGHNRLVHQIGPSNGDDTDMVGGELLPGQTDE